MYQLTEDPGIILRIDDGTRIPLADPDGAAQREYAAWLAEGNTPQPAPTKSLDELKLAATIKIDADADDIRRAVLGARATEYQTAYDEAKAFKDAMYAGTVPPTVQAWVDAKAAGGTAWTSQQAADDILATAAQWLNAQYAIRAARLKAKEKARAASDAAALDAALDEWAQFVVSIKVELGINPP